jgi:hypothetical protein
MFCNLRCREAICDELQDLLLAMAQNIQTWDRSIVRS